MQEKKSEEEQAQEKQLAPRMELIEEVLGNILDIHMHLNEISYKNASFLIGIAGVILTLIIAEVFPNMKEFDNLAKTGVGVIVVASLISLVINIEIIDPRFGERKRKNLFYYKSFLKDYSIDDYTKELSKLLKSEDAIIEQYAKEIYDLSRHVLEPKFRLLKLAARILIAGIVVGSAIVFSSVVIGN